MTTDPPDTPPPLFRRGEPTAEELMRQLEETQRLARLGSWSWEVRTGEVQWSRETYRILGYDPETVTPSFELVAATAVDDEHLAEFERMTERALAGEAPYDLVIPVRAADGALRYVHALGVVERNDDGLPTRMFGTLHDVTEAHEREQALAESEQRFRALAESSPFGVFLVNAAGHATYASPSLLELFDMELEPFCAGEWQKRILEEDVDHAYAHGSQARDQQRASRYSYRIRVRGETRHIRITTRPRFEESGAYLGQVGVVEDITSEVEARREKEELEAQLRHAQQLDSLGVLAGGIAHDFNNLLVGVLANAEMAVEDLEPGHPAADAVRDIQTAAERAAELTRQLLAYAGKWAVVVETVDLSVLVEEVVQLLRTVVSRRATLEVACDDAAPPVMADPTQLRQILINLLKNASDALGGASGDIRVCVRTETADGSRPGRVFGEPLVEGRQYATIVVEDTGMGIDDGTLDRIFDPFYSGKGAGRGLGLATTLRIVRSHGGSIRVRTAPGEGSTFTLLLPPTDKVTSSAGPQATPEVEVAGKGTILVVDDEPEVRDVVGRILERAGFTVITAEDGAQALDLHEQNRESVRAVILDLTMPVLGGEEVLRELRAQDADLPVVLMSGFADFQVGPLLGDGGATTFIDKPFGRPALLEALAGVLETTGR